jgi:glucose/arabinose dehydrogenase
MIPVFLFLLACLGSATVAHAQLRAQVVATGLTQPVLLVPDPVLDDVLYVGEKGGLVKVIRDGQLLPEPFADLRSLVSSGVEQGLLGMAFSPDVASGRVFFHFTDTQGHSVIVRSRRLAASPLRVDPASRFDLRWSDGRRVIAHQYPLHYGGQLQFGPDGHLYVALGDGGSPWDVDNNAQNPAVLLGKILRLDVFVDDADPNGYAVPQDNPFVAGSPVQALPEIWAFGFRNPWRFSFDDFGTGATGALIIGDVGQSTREEVNYEPRGRGGRNYGWRLREGRTATPGVTGTRVAFEPLTDPILDYAYFTEGRSVTGGFVYRGVALGPEYHGRYFFGDFAYSRVWSVGLSLDPLTGEATVADVIEHTGELGRSLGGIASFGRDNNGELYLVTFAGRVAKIVQDLGEVPGAPEMSATVVGDVVTVSWIPPANSTLIEGYQIEAGSREGATDLAMRRVPADQRTLTAAAVPAGTYHVRVRAIARAGVGEPSQEAIVTVPGSCAGSVPHVSAVVSNGAVTRSWALPENAAEPTAFALEAGSGAGQTDVAAVMIAGRERELTVRPPAGTYFVRLRSIAACGNGPASTELLVHVP